MAFFGVDM